MRKLLSVAVASTAVMAVACGKGAPKTSTSMSADLQRDLKLASATQTMQISPDEVAPQSHKELSLKLKKAPDGPKVIRSEHPTVKASATAVEAADIKSQVPQVQVMASAPGPSESPTTDAPPLARPAAMPTQGYPSAGAIPSDGPGVWGSIFRGGILGDDDHCDPRSTPRRPRPIGDIYGRPGPMGGMGGARLPVTPIGRPRM